MRLSALLLLISLHAAAASFSQNVTISVKEEKLGKVFTLLRKQTGFDFFCDARLLRDANPVTLTVSNRPLAEVLKLALANQSLNFTLVDNAIVISPKPAQPNWQPSAWVSITGRVLDASTNTPLPGASIVQKGTQNASASDQQGNFVVRSDKNEATVVVSSIGYETQELTLRANQPNIIRMVRKAADMSETVVTGIIARKSGSFTGAATTFTAQELRQAGNRNLIQSLRALDPSFQVAESNLLGSNPNQLPDIQVRGASNLPDLRGDYTGSPNLPLFIMDGFEVPLQRVFDLDMNRVERITILKDATATALYGSRSANGVVVIQTKEPEAGKMRISYTGDFTLETPDLREYNLLNAAQKLEIEKAAGLYSAPYNLTTQQGLDELYNRRLAEVNRGVNTDWISQPLQNSFGQRHYLYLEGGDRSLRYAMDLSANLANGVMKESGRKTYTGGMMLSYRVKNLLFRNYLSVTQNKATNSPYGDFTSYARMNPYWRMKDANGNILQAVDSISTFGSVNFPALVANPLYNSTLNTQDYSQYLQVNDNFSLEWLISPDLKLRSNFSLQTQRNEFHIFKPADHTDFLNYAEADYLRKGSYTLQNGKTNLYEFSTYLDFNRTFGGRHLFYATAGVNGSDQSGNTNTLVAEGFPSQNLDDPGYGGQYQQGGRPLSSDNKSRRISFLSNINYSYDNRYVADLSVSTDGSSRFGSDNRFAPFWAVGAGWNIHNEAWAKSLRAISYLKLRASYGSTGTQNFPSYQAMTTYSYFTQTRYLNAIGAYLISLGNSELKWQQKNTLNIGADITLFRGKLSLTANYYDDRTQNQLIDLSIPPSMGFVSYKENLGEVSNKGYELNARYFLVRNNSSRFSWSVNASVFHNSNKLLKISNALKAYNEQQNKDQVDNNSTSPTLLYQEGQSITAIYTVRSLGIDPATGREVFLKRDGSKTFVWSAEDKVVTGDATPEFQGLFGTNIMYQGFTLNVIFRYYFGGQLYNQTLVDRVENADIRYNVDNRVYEGRWRQPGDHTFFKNVADRSVTLPSSRFVQDDNVLNCESVNLQYDFAQTAFLRKLPLQTLRLNLYANNPFRISSVKQERGLAYPFAQSYSFSIQTSF
ncbi:MAG: SusC/RagA family TonB-linked outer membrane protein [Candidatus Pseudobacter hemicellulosilyticus]|uniref:SusC/RagA family TonB-linked outer membrane protein n=1 Tax=Candidatus Pseudobacter hemicellulosilyticus TaxID=3121375 RepID=A0AAJ5WRE3_9BACT|nr:MAG: SusC/RagA family TonB-linked outer membrane protein [Pseudobacter sp.]